ncbi:MAG: molecular chaperone HtpG [Clostridia bacterium]|nr:molecular chaperone HtpG [Clostridia bacterium]
MANFTEHGGISIELEHIFPIIKKWLYSEKEIFLREIVSNACDAVTKLKRLISLGEAKDIVNEPGKIKVILNTDAKTITVTDDGIGMSENELRQYICQIALSGAIDFINKYEGSEDAAASNGIIGHFGLGFYSSFMVSDTVDIITKSYNGEPAVKWSCGDDGQFEITTNYDDYYDLIGERGTAIVMHVNDEGAEFLSEYKLKEVLAKYCAFMPVEIFFENSADNNEETNDSVPVNDPSPLWQKNPSECTEEEYKDFYGKVFHDFKEPLFHIHLKADYPLNFKGILYFPRIRGEFESLEGQVKLYYNQVFVADNIKEVIPEYLLMLKGVLDCPELPLNVSRSYLQNSGYVSKISAHITKKVADKLTSMFNSDRENYESLWRDLKTFVEYGCMRDAKFADRVKGAVLYEKCSGGFVTLEEYLDSAKDKHENKVYYTTDKTAQSKYISMLATEGIEVILLDKIIDTQYINSVEMANEGVKFLRVDSEIAEHLRDDGEIREIEAVAEVFRKVAGENVEIKFDRFKDSSVPAVINVSEESRRIEDLMRLYAMNGMDSSGFKMNDAKSTLTVNTASPLIEKLENKCDSDPDLAAKIAQQIYSLSLLSQRKLDADELLSLIDGSYSILGLL